MKPSILNKVVKEARKSKHNYKIGAVVFKGGNIFGSGHNSFRSNSIHPKYKVWHGSLHAEQSAVLGLDWSRLKGASILVVRITNNENLSMAYPCDVCLDLIRYIRIKKLYYSDRNGGISMEKMA